MASGYEKSEDYGGPEPSWKGLLFIIMIIIGLFMWLKY
jgi:hypothetical protein